MNISAATNQHYASQSQQNSTPASDNSASFASIMDTATAETKSADSVASKEVSQPDFTNMTRQELFEWMNNQLREGKMTLDESTPFLLMTVRISPETGQLIDVEGDSTRFNFLERAHQGVEGAISRDDQDLVARLQRIIEIMQTHQA